MRVTFRGRRSIWSGWIVTPVVPRIVNEVSYVMMIKQANNFVVLAWYFVVRRSTTGVVLCSTK